MKNKALDIVVIGMSAVIYGMYMSARVLPGLVGTPGSVTAAVRHAGLLPVVVYLLRTLVYICFIAAGAGFLMVRRWGISFLRATISAGLVLNLFGILNYWYHAVFVDRAPLAMEGRLVARSSIVPVYIIFIFQIAALYFINRPSVTQKFEEKRSG